jgi:pimeloyl-ACP methyl ester carboxylesterase
LVEGRPAIYGTAGPEDGLPLLFVHGWALGHHAYKRSLKRLAKMGVRVIAPALPGFGGTADLPRDQFSLGGFASWLRRFLDELRLDEPAVVVGHSFGGGAAIMLAHDHPDCVRSLVLVNSIGGSAWKSSGRGVRSMADRPLWDWGLHFPSDILPVPQITRVLPVVLEDLVPNLLRNPRAVWKVGQLARRADLTPELEELKQRGLPVVVLWGADDHIIPRESFDALCAAIGAEGEVVEGNHSWLLADPDAFGEVLTNSVEVARVARDMEQLERQLGKRARRRRGVLGLARSAPRQLRSIQDAKPGDED